MILSFLLPCIVFIFMEMFRKDFLKQKGENRFSFENPIQTPPFLCFSHLHLLLASCMSSCLACRLIKPCPDIVLPMLTEVSVRDDNVVPHHRYFRDDDYLTKKV